MSLHALHAPQGNRQARRAQAAGALVHGPGEAVPAAPLFIGPANCVSIVGWTWRFTRVWALARGITVLRLGSKPLIEAAALIKAIADEHAKNSPTAEPEPLTDEEEQRRLAASIGLVRRPGASR